jgi:hypothetical protein
VNSKATAAVLQQLGCYGTQPLKQRWSLDSKTLLSSLGSVWDSNITYTVALQRSAAARVVYCAHSFAVGSSFAFISQLAGASNATAGQPGLLVAPVPCTSVSAPAVVARPLCACLLSRRKGLGVASLAVLHCCALSSAVLKTVPQADMVLKNCSGLHLTLLLSLWFTALPAVLLLLQLGTHLRGKKKREEMAGVLRKQQKAAHK